MIWYTDFLVYQTYVTLPFIREHANFANKKLRVLDFSKTLVQKDYSISLVSSSIHTNEQHENHDISNTPNTVTATA